MLLFFDFLEIFIIIVCTIFWLIRSIYLLLYFIGGYWETQIDLLKMGCVMGSKVRYYRQKAEINQKEFAKMVGVTRQTINSVKKWKI